MNGTVKICGHNYDLRKVERSLWSDDGIGRSSVGSARIEVISDLSHDALVSTTLHEIVHQIACLNNLDKLNVDECAISVLANSLMLLIRDNPYLISWMQSPNG